MMVLGLTGGIACGKSSVSNIFAQEGFAVIDTDQIAHELYEENREIQERLTKEFGTFDRAKLRDIVFPDPDKRKKLEELVHPAIREKTLISIANEKDLGHRFIVVTVPLLFEANWQQHADKILVIVSSKQNQIQRLMQRGLPKSRAIQMIDSQMSNDEKVKRSDYFIENNGTLEDLERETKRLIRLLQSGCWQNHQEGQSH